MRSGIPFGNYQLLRRLARGGMAEVFLAQQKGLEGFQRVVALKRILPHLVDNQDFVRMFLDEARLAARLSHPNVVHIYDFGKVSDHYFIAMEFVQGIHTGELIRFAAAQNLPAPLVARIGADACAGLAYAHDLADEMGKPLSVVHRDVSPANLLVSYDGVVKLVDFGIAKAVSSIEQTRPGIVKGKYAYMSPEQTTGKRLDGHSDVFSLGVVLWELLAGQGAVTRNDQVAAMKMIRDGKIPAIGSIRPDLPGALCRVIDRALALKPEDRPSARELGLSFEEFIKGSDQLGSSHDLARFVGENFPRKPIAELTPEEPAGTRHATQATRFTSPGTRYTVQSEQLSAQATIDATDPEVSATDLPGKTTIITPPKRAAQQIAGSIARDAPPRPNADDVIDTIQSSPLQSIIVDETGGHRQPPPYRQLVSPNVFTGDTARLDTANLPALLSKSALGSQDFAELSETIDESSQTIARLPSEQHLPPPAPSSPSMPVPVVAAPTTARGHALWTGIPQTGDVHTNRGRGFLWFGLAVCLIGIVAVAITASQATSKNSGAAAADEVTANETVGSGREAPGSTAASDPVIVTQLPEPAPAVLEIITVPAGAEVSVDGADGPAITPTQFHGIAEGAHRVTVTMAGYQPIVRSVELEAGEHKTLELSLTQEQAELVGTSGDRSRATEKDRNRSKRGTRRGGSSNRSKEPATSGPPGYLKVRTRPYSTVYLGGRRLGQTPLANVELLPGRHKLTFKNPDHATVTRTVTVRSGETTKLDFGLDE